MFCTTHPSTMPWDVSSPAVPIVLPSQAPTWPAILATEPRFAELETIANEGTSDPNYWPAWSDTIKGPLQDLVGWFRPSGPAWMRESPAYEVALRHLLDVFETACERRAGT